ncbi:hypothetical protein ACO2Q2_01760 [Dyella sp. KRB-257]|uniref:hypothetical protein n=1 Tax=Dyella sp. KRB-257 TaxID=3400915 RepID=UPI003C101A2F
MTDELDSSASSRRHFLQTAGLVGSAGLLGSGAALAAATNTIRLPFANGQREITSAFPQKGPMLLLRDRSPLLETPFDVFDHGVFTPNNRFYVRWHLPSVPTTVDADAFRLKVHGHTDKPLSLRGCEKFAMGSEKRGCAGEAGGSP